MILQLTEQQRQMVAEQAGRPIDVIDPDTQHAYVLIARDQFEKVRSMLDESPQSPSPSQASFEIPPGIRRSQEAFWRDLPNLLKQKKLIGRWVCYHGDEQIGVAKTDTELVQACLRRGLKRNEFYVGWINELPAPPWESFDLEESLFEAAEFDSQAQSSAQ